MLSCCKKALDCFKTRHDYVLKHLLDEIVKKNKEGLKVYADLNGWRVNGGTVTPDLALTPWSASGASRSCEGPWPD